MSYTREIIEDVRSQIAVSDDSITEAKARRAAVMTAAEKFDGALRVYKSGSLAHGTANDCADGDCGVVLDRRVHTTLGPDSEDGKPPNDVVADMHAHLRSELVDEYPDIKISSKGRRRSIEICFNQPADSHNDPSVDVIVGLTRKDESGIWIPNLKARRWDASDPETHTDLLTAKPKNVRVLRARVIRLAKAQAKQFRTATLIPFNISALALDAISAIEPIEQALYTFYEHAVADLEKRLTPDPAGVSPAIKLPLEKSTVLSRLRACRDKLEEAMAHDDDHDRVQALMNEIFFDYVEIPASASVAQHLAVAARGTTRFLGLGAGLEMPQKSTRAYGARR